MAGELFNLDIVTPKKTVFSGRVESFSAPGVIGGFQVLRGHAPFLSALKVGEAKIRDSEGRETYYATSGGFVEVRDNKVVMLAETAERADEIDVQRARAARDRAKKRIEEKRLETDLDRARQALERALNRLKVAGRVQALSEAH